MIKNKMKLFGISIAAVSLVIMTALPVSAKSRRLTPADNCSIAFNDPDLRFSTGSYLYATGTGSYVCGIPNDTYMGNSDIYKINAHFYNSSSVSSTLSAKVCTRSYQGDTTDCEVSKSTTTTGEVYLSWTGVTLTKYADATYLFGTLSTGDRLRLIWVTE
jgi:hypothetical protein